jgi:hypothetical protein
MLQLQGLVRDQEAPLPTSHEGLTADDTGKEMVKLGYLLLGLSLPVSAQTK